MIELKTYVAEDVVTAVEQSRELIIWICEVFEAIFPQPHVFEAAERFVITLDPVGRGERHQQENSTNVGHESSRNKGICWK